MTTRIVAVVNQKGGVGKTTTTVNLSHALARMGRKVTVIDLDPQCHLAVALGMVAFQQSGLDEVLMGNRTLEQQSAPVRENLNLVVAGPRLKEIEQLQDGGAQRADLLHAALSGRLLDQDFVFIDCPPSSGILVANALMVAEEVLIPMTGDFLALQGLSHLMGTIKKFEQRLQKQYRLLLVMSRYVPTRRLSQEVVATMQKYFAGKILATVVRETSLLAECPSFGKTIFEYRPGCRSARDFSALAQDFLHGRVM